MKKIFTIIGLLSISFASFAMDCNFQSGHAGVGLAQNNFKLDLIGTNNDGVRDSYIIEISGNDLGRCVVRASVGDLQKGETNLVGSLNGIACKVTDSKLIIDLRAITHKAYDAILINKAIWAIYSCQK